MSDEATSPTDSTSRPNGTAGPSSPAGAPTPNPRSCVTCRRRKVKCDKKNPCSNCVRAKIECVFPGPGRAPRKSRKPPDAELLERLRRLEGVVSSLNAQVEEHEQEAADREKDKQNGDKCPFESKGESAPKQNRSVIIDNSVEGLENRFGRLVVEKGRSRYINNSFWASLNNEVEDLKSILIEPSDDEEDPQSPDSSNNSSHQGFLFGYSSTSVDMQALHPGEQQARQFWEVYKENVDPLVKVLHIPTFQTTFFDAVGRIEKVPKALEALLFSIYYGAVTSTLAEDCVQRWGEDRGTLLKRYRFGLEQALARANFLYCDEIVILQAFVIFLVLLRRNDDARKIWTLTGLVVRIAQTLGVHRDGSHFGLPPFEIEMRRRLWWQVCILDSRSSEDHGCDPTIVEAQFDTKMPLNVNDVDLHPEMKEFPEERQGFTDMSFGLLRFEVANIFRRILYIPPGPNMCNQFFASLSIPDKEKWIIDAHQKMEDKYLKNCDLSQPLQWVTATISRLIMSKMWLIVYHPHQRKDGGATLPQETKDRLFITSLENLEYSILLETEARTMKWGWLFRTYVQWHAIAFLLSELCVRTKGEAVERAWKALETTASRWWFPLNDANLQQKSNHGALWKPLKKLFAKARAARERELALERASQAIRNAQMGYNYPQSLIAMRLPAEPGDPASENLDKLLRPTAPRLGETPTAAQPSWPNTPSSPASRHSISNPQSPNPSQPVDGMSKQRPLPSENLNRRSASLAHQFNDLSTFGLDSVLRDVMTDMTSEGPMLNTDHAVASGLTPNRAATAPQPTQPVVPAGPAAFSTGDAMNGIVQPDFTGNPFSNSAMDFNTTPPMLDANGQTMQSPILDEGAMDWALWDDLVTQFGVDGQAPNPINTGVNGVNGPGHVGMVHWF